MGCNLWPLFVVYKTKNRKPVSGSVGAPLNASPGTFYKTLKTMKLLFTTLLFIILSVSNPVLAAGNQGTGVESLRKEIEGIVRHRPTPTGVSGVEEVKVDFLINANREVVVFGVTGDNLPLCDHVKSVLNFRKVSFREAKQLHPYSVTIRYRDSSASPVAVIRA